jgi:uncharacterized protein YbcI
MHRSQRTIGQRVAQAAHDFELRRTKHGRKWVAVFMNEDSVMIALHGSLKAAEKTLMRSSAGAAQVREFHGQLFTKDSASLLREIKCITGLEVRETTAEIEPTTSSVVQVFATDTVGVEFLLAPGGPAGTRVPRHEPLR